MAIEIPDDSLFELLREHLLLERVSSNAKVLAPLYKHVGNNQYSLLPQTELSTTTICRVIAGTIGSPVGQIKFFSLDNPFGMPQDRLYLCRDICKETLALDSKSSLWIRPSDNLFNVLKDDLGDRLHHTTRVSLQELWVCIKASLGDGLSSALLASLWRFRSDAAEKLIDIFMSTLMGSLLFFLGFELVQDREVADRLRPMIGLLPNCIPLASQIGDSNTWTVVCA